MLLIAIFGLTTVSTTVLLHAIGTAWWLRRLRNRSRAPRGATLLTLMSILVKTALVLIALHALEVSIWALVLRFLPEGGLTSLEEATYFSFTTFTTLGYGDVTLAGPWRMLTGIEALNGVLLIGWSTAVSFAVIQRILESLDRERDEAHLPAAPP